MTEKLSDLLKDTNLQIQQAWQTAVRVNSKKTTPGREVIKLLRAKGKEKLLEAIKKTPHIRYDFNGCSLLIRNHRENRMSLNCYREKKGIKPDIHIE